MEFLSVFLSSEDIISGLNKGKNTNEVEVARMHGCVININMLCMCI